MSLEWNVFYESINTGKITTLNVFDHHGFLDDCRKIDMVCRDRESFDREVKKSLTYYFRWKCEYEIVLSDWPPSNRTPARKIDVYDQVCLNWQAFSNYLWENRSLLQS